MRAPTFAPRANNRSHQLRDAAAHLFARRGYDQTTVREIAAACEMTAGAVYVHFGSKRSLLIAVYSEAVTRVTQRLTDAVADIDCPWQRLEGAVRAHLEAVLEPSDYARVMTRVLPEEVSEARVALIALRDRYEAVFRELVVALPLLPYTDRGLVRLLLLGAINWIPFWYGHGGATPSDIAKLATKLLREGIAQPTAMTS
ncbi:MAG: TetR/AcrR family transcriptional regulator [Pseudomonadota bacterium]|nr:TetR/AcrR family transcriptional regulator [Pseudomonadota bacterium]